MSSCFLSRIDAEVVSSTIFAETFWASSYTLGLLRVGSISSLNKIYEGAIFIGVCGTVLRMSLKAGSSEAVSLLCKNWCIGMD